MSRAILAEAREVFLVMSMLIGLSVTSLAVACGAVILADNQTMHVAALALASPANSLHR